jgi:hypothetical protein
MQKGPKLTIIQQFTNLEINGLGMMLKLIFLCFVILPCKPVRKYAESK